MYTCDGGGAACGGQEREKKAADDGKAWKRNGGGTTDNSLTWPLLVVRPPVTMAAPRPPSKLLRKGMFPCSKKRHTASGFTDNLCQQYNGWDYTVDICSTAKEGAVLAATRKHEQEKMVPPRVQMLRPKKQASASMPRG